MKTYKFNSQNAVKIGTVLLFPGNNYISSEQEKIIESAFENWNKANGSYITDHYRRMITVLDNGIKVEKEKKISLDPATTERGYHYSEVEYDFNNMKEIDIKDIIDGAYDMEDVEKMAKSLQKVGMDKKKIIKKAIKDKRDEIEKLEESEAK